jgi:hypothetical protein
MARRILNGSHERCAYTLQRSRNAPGSVFEFLNENEVRLAWKQFTAELTGARFGLPGCYLNVETRAIRSINLLQRGHHIRTGFHKEILSWNSREGLTHDSYRHSSKDQSNPPEVICNKLDPFSPGKNL